MVSALFRLLSPAGLFSSARLGLDHFKSPSGAEQNLQPPCWELVAQTLGPGWTHKAPAPRLPVSLQFVSAASVVHIFVDHKAAE